MRDGIVKGTGNSRYLKSVEDILTLYPTYEEFCQALAEGTLPIEFNGINETAWDIVGTPLNKSTLLTDETEIHIWGDAQDRTVDEALRALPHYRRVTKTEIFTSTTNWKVPVNVKGTIFVRLFGGGGGGAFGTLSYATIPGGFGGGGGGHMATGTFEIAPETVVPITIGAGGTWTGGAVAHSGVSGGATSFGTYLSANGGSGGAYVQRQHGANGGDGGTGGGAGGFYFPYDDYIGGGRGGNGSYGGGGGAGAGMPPASINTYCYGGNGGTYGGGGGGAGAGRNLNTHGSSGGTGGTYGGNGGKGGCCNSQDESTGEWIYNAAPGEAGTNTVGMDLDFTGTGAGGTIHFSNLISCGGGGGGGYGGIGGNGGYSSESTSNGRGGGGGGGGGYGGRGGDGNAYAGGGGGGYGGRGGNASSSSEGSDTTYTGGGGGGYGPDNYGCGGNGYCGDTGNDSPGKSGICIVTYTEYEVV